MKRRAAPKRPKRTGTRAGLVHRFGARLPQPTTEACARVTAWLATLRRRPVGKSLTMLIRQSPALLRVLGGVGEAAPYLRQTIEAKPARLLRLLRGDPALILAALIERTQAAAARARSQVDLMHYLREMKLESALLIALTDIGAVWNLAQITQALTRVADAAVALSADHLLKEAMRKKRIKSATRKGSQSGSGYIVLAMGKMGGGELNFSSDIDLMVFFDAKLSLADDVEPAPFFIGLTRDLIKILQTRTPDGYVFRVRFAAASGPIINSDCNLNRCRVGLLREPRPGLGARGARQGATVRRRHPRRGTISSAI